MNCQHFRKKNLTNYNCSSYGLEISIGSCDGYENGWFNALYCRHCGARYTLQQSTNQVIEGFGPKEAQRKTREYDPRGPSGTQHIVVAEESPVPTLTCEICKAEGPFGSKGLITDDPPEGLPNEHLLGDPEATGMCPRCKQKTMKRKREEGWKRKDKPFTGKGVITTVYNEVIKDQEHLIREQFANITFPSPEERERFLFRQLACAQVYAQFTQIGMLISGSQFGILVHATSQLDGIGEDFVKKTYEDMKLADPDYYAATSYESYKGLLLNTNLLHWDRERLKLTFFGEKFLKHIFLNGLNRPRRG
jgi:hypothetical protein